MFAHRSESPHNGAPADLNLKNRRLKGNFARTICRIKASHKSRKAAIFRCFTGLINPSRSAGPVRQPLSDLCATFLALCKERRRRIGKCTLYRIVKGTRKLRFNWKLCAVQRRITFECEYAFRMCTPSFINELVGAIKICGTLNVFDFCKIVLRRQISMLAVSVFVRCAVQLLC